MLCSAAPVLHGVYLGLFPRAHAHRTKMADLPHARGDLLLFKDCVLQLLKLLRREQSRKCTQPHRNIAQLFGAPALFPPHAIKVHEVIPKHKLLLLLSLIQPTQIQLNQPQLELHLPRTLVLSDRQIRQKKLRIIVPLMLKVPPLRHEPTKHTSFPPFSRNSAAHPMQRSSSWRTCGHRRCTCSRTSPVCVLLQTRSSPLTTCGAILAL
mmetsp:Transcript_11074/g.23759  ORF Transcript_11074/g.23759 Transcript_11074/m.23759 type:complete len:209 (-) Transcript_11074:1180-1806(-)